MNAKAVSGSARETFKTIRRCLRSLCKSSREVVMSGKIVARLIAFATANAALLSTPAFASQGPGIAPGTAGAMTQLGMAIIVYGGSAAIVIFGLLGALRHR
jgi:hypothetical protein